MLFWTFWSIVLAILSTGITGRELPRGLQLHEGDAYIHQGDVMIGVFLDDVAGHALCGDNEEHFLDILKEIGALNYAMNVINNDSELLHGVQLGYIAPLTCYGDLTNLARALTFVPQQTQQSTHGNFRYQHYQRVVGVYGSIFSQSSVITAPVLGLAEIPQISSFATSDVLSNKALYPYFMRVAPSDRYQAKAIVDVIRYFKWSYVSTLHRPDNYGQNGISKVHKLFKEYDICVKYSGVIHSDSMTSSDYDEVYSKLKRRKKSRVVIVFASSPDLKGILDAITRANDTDDFIWIVSDAVFNIDDMISQMTGAIKIELYAEPIAAIDTYTKSLTLNDFSFGTQYSGQDWISNAWSKLFGCSLNATDVNSTTCSEDLTLHEDNDYTPYGRRGSSVMDIINTFAHGLHELIRNECPAAFNDTAQLDDCIKGPLFKDYLISANFTGTWGQVMFNELGDILGRYSIGQVQLDADKQFQVVQIGTWDVQTNVNLNINNTRLNWHHHKDQNQLQSEYPESICSFACKPGEFYIKQELKCCWECKKCRSNEITIKNASTCAECPRYKWPDQKTFESCLDITSAYLQFSDYRAITVSVISVLGILTCIITSVLLIKNRKRKLVKASNRQLTGVILLGTTLAYLTVFMIIIKPETVFCYLSCLGFHISSALAYAPMAVKANRVYRIFEGGKRMIQPRLISSRWQIIVTLGIISTQIMISLCTATVMPPIAIRHQPVTSEKFVELQCWIPPESLVLPLAFNLVLIIVCAYYGFKTRLLPDNFNESKFIFFSISTTLFLWIAFLPTYFTAYYGHNKATLLSALLILNASVTIIVFFLPKLYALYYIDENKMKFTPFTGGTNSIQPSTSTSGSLSMGQQRAQQSA